MQNLPLHLRRLIAQTLDAHRRRYLHAVDLAQRDPSVEAGQILTTCAQDLDRWSSWVEGVLGGKAEKRKRPRDIVSVCGLWTERPSSHRRDREAEDRSSVGI